MAQFWETKDELIKSVSISLMKQIMQKPGIGWVRGDKANSEEALSKELTILSKENRGLRERIIELESKISPRIPKIELDITKLIIDDKYHSFEAVVPPKEISINDVEEHLRKYISEEELQKYNDVIPNQSTIDEYNDELERFYKIQNYSIPLVIRVCNVGTVKANNLYIDIKFPDEIFVFDKNKEIKPPQNPIPYSPIKKAQRMYEKELHTLQVKDKRLGNILNDFGSFVQPQLYNQNLKNFDKTMWTDLDGNELTIKIKDLIHTRCRIFDDEYMIVPLKAGKHKIQVQVICEELENLDCQIIEIEVQKKL